jgi:tetratricopeptide (TPR) repeat protein
VINAAAGAQTSHRVRRIVDEVVQLEPDLLVVLTGNNEGVPNPAALREAAQRFASYRLLRSLVRPAIADPERPAWTPQLLPPEALREQLRANLEAIAAATGRLGVPVLLATLPIHLRYVGGGAPPGPGWVPPDPNVDACTAGAKERQEAGDPRGALEAVEACEQSPSALLWAGLALADLGRHDEAKQALEASVELLPRNRCRPSLNAVTRQVAAAHGHAHAVDLEALFAASAPGGLPAVALRVAADEAGVGPGPAPAIPTWQGAQARAWGLPEDPSVWPDPQPR